jgi:hypothetical protein
MPAASPASKNIVNPRKKSMEVTLPGKGEMVVVFAFIFLRINIG